MSWRPTIAQRIPLSTPFTVMVQKAGEASPITVDVRSNYTVADLVMDVMGEEGISKTCWIQRNGVVLKLNEPLESSPHPLYLTTGIPAGGPHLHLPPFPPREITTIQPDLVGDPWRVVSPGLSLRSKCKNQCCPAFAKTIYANYEFGSFSINQVRNVIRCPACHMLAFPGENIGFLQTKFSILGMTEEEEEFRKEGMVTCGMGYSTLIERDIRRWGFLEVTASPL